jgi:hypothetical protein
MELEGCRLVDMRVGLEGSGLFSWRGIVCTRCGVAIACFCSELCYNSPCTSFHLHLLFSFIRIHHALC